ncbi:MAG TPA: GTPase, partial [Nitrospirota bacterium]|nr:GTPase [Nitrospirota bacterium]
MSEKARRRVIIMGAGGRDFHNFNVYFRAREGYNVVAFTAAQIPFIEKRTYPPSLAGPLYPDGIPVFPEERLPELIHSLMPDVVVFAYSDVSQAEVMQRASETLALGPDFMLMGPDTTMIKSSLPVISVCAVRTGAGKSPLTRKLAGMLRRLGRKPVVIRHPMAYSDLERQRVQRFSSMDDLDGQRCTIEEREEYEPLVKAGVTVFAGVDYEDVLRGAEREADVIIWDGGNNDFPFVEPDL